jgi:hypothetical protein
MGLPPKHLKIDSKRQRDRELERALRDTEKRYAESIITFLDFRFGRQKPPLPNTPLGFYLVAHRMNSREGLKEAARVQKKIRAVLTPALDAMANSDVMGDPVAELLQEFAAVQGNPFRYLKGKKEWENWPTANIDSFQDRWLAMIATLFAARKITLLAHCQHCGVLFLGQGRGRPAKYCRLHTRTTANERLRKENYFAIEYRKRKARGIERAKELIEEGIFGDRLLARLKRFGIGKTLLRRAGLWKD